MFWISKRRAERKRQSELHAVGREAGAAITQAIDTFLQRRLGEISVGYLRVFRERLKNIDNDHEHNEVDLAKAELQIFIENAKEAGEKLFVEAHSVLWDWFDFAKELGVLSEIDQYTRNIIADSRTALVLRAVELAGEAVQSRLQ